MNLYYCINTFTFQMKIATKKTHYFRNIYRKIKYKIMKNLLITFMIFWSLQLLAQDFAPLGATWYYTENFVLTGDKAYLKIKSVKDTLFQGKNCKLLFKTTLLQCNNRTELEIVYAQDSAVYFWDKDFAKFQKLYDFKVTKGNYWSILIKHDLAEIDTIKVYVDSISTTKILNKTHKVLYVSYHPSYYNYVADYSSKIVFPIGDFTYLFNFAPYWAGACDFNTSGGLRCYEDSEFGYYSTAIADSCTYIYKYKWNSIDKLKDNDFKVVVAPNPTQGKLKISCNDNLKYKICLIDCFGRNIKTGNFMNEVVFDISAYPKGMYFILIQNETGMTSHTKIIKN